MTKVVIRVLDADGQILGWCEHQARLRGDGCLRASAQVIVLLERAGRPAMVSIHWVDPNVETRVPVSMGPVTAPDAMGLFPANAVLMMLGPMPVLPAVTVRSAAAVGVPVGQLGAVGS